jgi:hypothetical protein
VSSTFFHSIHGRLITECLHSIRRLQQVSAGRPHCIYELSQTLLVALTGLGMVYGQP